METWCRWIGLGKWVRIFIDTIGSECCWVGRATNNNTNNVEAEATHLVGDLASPGRLGAHAWVRDDKLGALPLRWCHEDSQRTRESTNKHPN